MQQLEVERYSELRPLNLSRMNIGVGRNTSLNSI